MRKLKVNSDVEFMFDGEIINWKAGEVKEVEKGFDVWVIEKLGNKVEPYIEVEEEEVIEEKAAKPKKGKK